MPRTPQPLLSPQALQSLQHAKQQILDAAVGRIPERLVEATTRVAVRPMQTQSPVTEDTERALELARDILRCLAREKWKPDTALELGRRREGGGHAFSE